LFDVIEVIARRLALATFVRAMQSPPFHDYCVG
jgi:hypothetical protein